MVGSDDKICPNSTAKFLICVGKLDLRHSLFQSVQSLNLVIPKFIHNSSVVARECQVSSGCIIYPGVTICSNVALGLSVLVNANVSIGHETKIGDFCNINPGVNIAGGCVVGGNVFFGIGSSVIENVHICDGVVIGAGAVVINDIVEHGTYLGVPAKKV